MILQRHVLCALNLLKTQIGLQLDASEAYFDRLQVSLRYVHHHSSALEAVSSISSPVAGEQSAWEVLRTHGNKAVLMAMSIGYGPH